MLKKLLNSGVDAIQIPDLKEKIIITNQITFYLGVISILYAIILLLFDFHLSAVFFIASLTIFLIFYLNSINFYNLSRFMLNAIPMVLVFYSNIILTKDGEGPNLGATLCQLSISILPFIVVSVSERILLALCVFMDACLILMVRSCAGWVEAGNFIEGLRSPTFEYLQIATAIAIGGVLLFLLSNINLKSKKVSADLLDEMSIKSTDQLKDKLKLDEYINEIEQTREEDKKRAWTATGLSQFGELLRTIHLGEQKLFDTFVSQLVSYIGVNQGGLFVVENDNNKDYLILKSCYAYERKKYIQKRVEIGEGLLGQAYLEKETIILTEIPERYTTITSGLGNATPSCIVIVPLIVNKEILGVLELAAFHVIEPYKIAFIEKLGENLASTISISKVNTHTQRLLIQSQEQTELMRTQEEEMRQNMEELQATQEEMYRKNAEVEENQEKIKTILKESNKKNLELSQMKDQMQKKSLEVEEKLNSLAIAEIGIQKFVILL